MTFQSENVISLGSASWLPLEKIGGEPVISSVTDKKYCEEALNDSPEQELPAV